jgi:hypothetical protein
LSKEKIELAGPYSTVPVTKIYNNTGQELIYVTRDKVELCLMKYVDTVEKRNVWTTPLAIFLTILLTFATTSFKTFVFGPEMWQAAFLIIAALSFGWLIYSLVKRPKAKKIDDIIEALRSSS